MKRQYIHLSSNPEIAYQVGQRKAKSPVILTIESGKAHNHNIKFYQGNKVVWLADYIPPYTPSIYFCKLLRI